MLRRLHADQPAAFAFTAANAAWAEAQISKYPDKRQASAIIPLLWRAQEQEGWLSRPAIEAVAAMLDLAYIRALEVATFYFMFQLQPVGSVAHVQICGTLSCMLCGSEDLIAVCRDRIAARPHALSADGRFSWEEVECLGACANAPMAQIGKDYYEDLTADSLTRLLDEMAQGRVPVPGSQTGRFAAEPASGPTTLEVAADARTDHNASVALAVALGDTLKRIDGTEVPLTAPWRDGGRFEDVAPPTPREEAKVVEEAEEPRPAEGAPVDRTGITEQQATETSRAKPQSASDPSAEGTAPVTEGVGDGSDAAPPDTGSREARPVAPSSEPTETPVTDEVGAARPVDAPSQAAAPVEAAPAVPVAERAPDLLDAPRGGAGDDLKRMSGVGPKLEGALNGLGVWHFDQIAAWGPAEVAWVDARLQFRGRVLRDDWIEQARVLARDPARG